MESRNPKSSIPFHGGNLEQLCHRCRINARVRIRKARRSGPHLRIKQCESRPTDVERTFPESAAAGWLIHTAMGRRHKTRQ